MSLLIPAQNRGSESHGIQLCVYLTGYSAPGGPTLNQYKPSASIDACVGVCGAGARRCWRVPDPRAGRLQDLNLHTTSKAPWGYLSTYVSTLWHTVMAYRCAMVCLAGIHSPLRQSGLHSINPFSLRLFHSERARNNHLALPICNVFCTNQRDIRPPFPHFVHAPSNKQRACRTPHILRFQVSAES